MHALRAQNSKQSLALMISDFFYHHGVMPRFLLAELRVSQHTPKSAFMQRLAIIHHSANHQRLHNLGKSLRAFTKKIVEVARWLKLVKNLAPYVFRESPPVVVPPRPDHVNVPSVPGIRRHAACGGMGLCQISLVGKRHKLVSNRRWTKGKTKPALQVLRSHRLAGSNILADRGKKNVCLTLVGCHI